MSETRTNIMGYTPDQLIELVAQWGNKPFRAKQLQRWIHQRGEADFEAMTDLARGFREQLAERCSVCAPVAHLEQRSTDGTRKWLFDVGQNNSVEAVYIPEEDRGTLCISSQAGCTVACPFCSTGYQGFNRNLTAAEIIGQLWFARDQLRQDPTAARVGKNPSPVVDDRYVTNVVFMGMGEPLLNYDQVLTSLRLMLDDNAYGLSRRRVTVSTSGVVPMMDRLAQDCPVALAVSLHAPNDALRDKLVPLNRKHPLRELIASCNNYLQYAPRDFITFEYIMLDGINDQPEHAQQLLEIAKQVRCKFNLIPYNPFPQSDLKRSPQQAVRDFSQRLQDGGVVTTVRKTRGDDIDAACGQLAGDIRDRTRIRERLPQQGTIMIQPERA